MKIKALRDISDFGIDLQEVVRYAYPQDVGIDLVTCVKTPLPVNERASFPTGIAVEFPIGTYGLVLPRSSLASAYSISVMAGVIDEGYRGEIFVELINHGHREVVFEVGNKIAQLVVMPYIKVKLNWLPDTMNISLTERGDKGYGSSGK